MGGLKKSNGSIIFSEWIKTLQTAYPYGMNDKVDNETIANKGTLIASWFSPLNRKYSGVREYERVKTNVISDKFFREN